MKKTLLPLAFATSIAAFSQISGNMPTEPVNGVVLGYTFDWNGTQEDNCQAAYTDYFGVNGYSTSVGNGGLTITTTGNQPSGNYILLKFTEFEGQNCDFGRIDMTNPENRRLKFKLNSSVNVPEFLVAIADNSLKINNLNPAIVALAQGENEFVVTMPSNATSYPDNFNFSNIVGIALQIRNRWDDANIVSNVKIDRVQIGNAIPTTNFANNGNAFGPGFFKFGFEGNLLENCVGEAVGVVEGGRPSWRGNGYTYAVENGSLNVTTSGSQEDYSGPEFHFFGNNCSDRRSINLSDADNRAISLKVNASGPAQLVIQLLDNQGRFASNTPVVITLSEGDNIINREFIPALSEFQGSALDAANIIGFMLVLRNVNGPEQTPKPAITAKFDYIEIADITTGLTSRTFNRANINPNPATDFINVEANSSVRFFNSNGVMVKEANSGTGRVSLEGVQKGIYMVQVINNGKVSSAKVIVE